MRQHQNKKFNSINSDLNFAMDKLNIEIDEMYDELVDDDGDASHLNSFDFSSIRDDFRQHIHSRRSNESSDLILLDDHLIQNLLKLKQETFSLLQKFRNVSIKQQSSKVKSFSSFKEFVSFVQNQEEILHSELWKLEAILNYIEALQLSESPPSRSPNLNSPKFHQ